MNTLSTLAKQAETLARSRFDMIRASESPEVSRSVAAVMGTTIALQGMTIAALADLVIAKRERIAAEMDRIQMVLEF